MVNNQGFIVLVDISGYTKFIRMHKMRKTLSLARSLVTIP